jgi:hypothetical protein
MLFSKKIKILFDMNIKTLQLTYTQHPALQRKKRALGWLVKHLAPSEL